MYTDKKETDKVKVSLITLHRLFNYGSVLQAYASKKLFENHGCEVEIVDYITEQRTNKRLFFGMPENFSGNIIKKYVYLFLKSFSVIIKKLTFGGFIKKNCNLTQKKYIKAEDIIACPPEADVYVTGSDQVWNSKYNEGIDKGFFLEYVPKDKKAIAFVSSFGKTELDESEKDLTREYLKKYSAISVREDDAAKIINDLGYSAEWLIDPTLQIDKSEWLGIASKRLIKEKYLILMLLYNEDNGATEYARRIADEKGLKLVKLSWDLTKPALVDKLMTHRPPQDFLSLFYNAEFVVTNSFHGLAFSINFNKQFVVVRRSEFNSRIESLLRLTGLEKRLVSSIEEAISRSSEAIDYDPVNKKLYEERNRAKEFIINAIS